MSDPLFLLRRTGDTPTKWKKSLHTSTKREADIEARKLAAEHDALISSARKPDAITTLSAEAKAAITLAGGVDGYLQWLDQRAADAAALLDGGRIVADELAAFPIVHRMKSRILTGQLRRQRRWDAERAVPINRQIARDVSVLRHLGNRCA